VSSWSAPITHHELRRIRGTLAGTNVTKPASPSALLTLAAEANSQNDLEREGVAMRAEAGDRVIDRGAIVRVRHEDGTPPGPDAHVLKPEG
jgi:hypothetical protein